MLQERIPFHEETKSDGCLHVVEREERVVRERALIPLLKVEREKETEMGRSSWEKVCELEKYRQGRTLTSFLGSSCRNCPPRQSLPIA